MPPNRNVKIAAKTVTVNTRQRNPSQSAPSKSAKRRARKKRSQINNVTVTQVPTGVQTGLSELAPKPQRVRRVEPIISSLDEAPRFSDQAYQFIENYCDPCGEHCQSIDSARVPDAAFTSSTGGFFRGLTTVVFPWQSPSEIDLTGKTYSMLFLQFPLFRALTIVLARRNDGEFGPDMMDRFVKVFGSLVDRALAFYPSWISLDPDDGNEYFTIIDSAVMREILPPGPSGVSGIIDAFRFTSQGMNIMFNTPDILNQGTVTCMRYPTNLSEKSYAVIDELTGATPLYLRAQGSSTGALLTAPISLNMANATTPMYPAFPSFVGLLSGLPSPIIVSATAYQDVSGTFSIAVGDSVNYIVGSGPTANQVYLINATTGQQLNVLTIVNPPATGVTTRTTRLYLTTGEDIPLEEVIDTSYSSVVIPPITQADMLQQNPKMIASVVKAIEGVYVVGSIYEPVFNVQESSQYRKVIMATRTPVPIDELDPTTGWFDTLDRNYGVSVVNFQGMPYACKPMVKIVRSVELVPSANSVVGLFTTGSPPEQAEAVSVCKAFTENQPHGYPTNWNSMGILFGKIMQVVECIPIMLRTGQNISRSVKQLCDLEAIQDLIPANFSAKRLHRGY